MTLALVTLIQTAERDAGPVRRPGPGRRRSSVLRRWAERGFRSAQVASSVFVRRVDRRAPRSSSV
jgi:hypothetical protein